MTPNKSRKYFHYTFLFSETNYWVRQFGIDKIIMLIMSWFLLIDTETQNKNVLNMRLEFSLSNLEMESLRLFQSLQFISLFRDPHSCCGFTKSSLACFLLLSGQSYFMSHEVRKRKGRKVAILQKENDRNSTIVLSLYTIGQVLFTLPYITSDARGSMEKDFTFPNNSMASAS